MIPLWRRIEEPFNIIQYEYQDLHNRRWGRITYQRLAAHRFAQLKRILLTLSIREVIFR